MLEGKRPARWLFLILIVPCLILSGTNFFHHLSLNSGESNERTGDRSCTDRYKSLLAYLPPWGPVGFITDANLKYETFKIDVGGSISYNEAFNYWQTRFLAQYCLAPRILKNTTLNEIIGDFEHELTLRQITVLQDHKIEIQFDVGNGLYILKKNNPP